MKPWPIDKLMQGPEYERYVKESLREFLAREPITLCNYVDGFGTFHRCEIKCSNLNKKLTYASMKEELIPDYVMLVRFSE
jgi:hypothetical protein